MVCPSCGTDVPAGSRFCSSCGNELRVRVSDERRVATVLFGDLVGFTGLSEDRDPEQVKSLVDRCFQRLAADIEAHGGRVDKIVGDGIVALFGAPVAHEDDAERAVRAALRMQETMAGYAAELSVEGDAPAIHMRIGVNTGEVLTGAMAAGGDYTAVGDVMNIASRLQSGAAPGSVVVGAATHTATMGAISYDPLGLFEARGRGEPVEAWLAKEAMVLPGRRPRRRRTPLIGRDVELTLLQSSVRLAFERRRANLVLLFGEAGVGKTRLADELKDWAELDQGAVVLEGRCVPYGEANLWFPFAAAVRDLCGVPRQTTPGEATVLVTDAVARELGAGSNDESVMRIAGGLLYLLGSTDALSDLDPQRARDEAARALTEIVERIVQHRPVFLRLADLHWADPMVLELIEAVLNGLCRSPVTIVATARQALEDRWNSNSVRHHRLTTHIDPLSGEAASSLLESLADGQLAGIDRDAVLARSGGNPLFLEELLALVGPQETSADGAATVSGGATLGLSELPETLRGLVAARLDRLGPSRRAVIGYASVFGHSGPLLALERMAATDHVVDVATVGDIVHDLVDRDLLELDDRVWAFRSDVVREVAYSTLTKADRAERHAGIASYVEGLADSGETESLGDIIAHHYSLAARLDRELGFVTGLPADLSERALRWLERAATRASEAEIHLRAGQLFDEAIDLVGDEPSARRLLFHLGRARARIGLFELDGARSDVSTALDDAESLDDRAGWAAARLLLGEIEQQAGNLDQAASVLNEVFAEFEELGDRRGAAEALRHLGMVSLYRGAYQEAEATTSVALERFLQLEDRRGQAWALQNLAWIAYMSGRVHEAETRLDASTELFSEVGDEEGIGWATGLLAFTKFQQGDLAEAERLAESILPSTQQRGDRFGEGMMLFLTALVRLWTGRTDQAIERAEQALEQATRTGDPLARSQAAGALGRALVNTGRIDEGFRTLESTSTGASRIAMSAQELGALVVASAAVPVGDVARSSAQLGLLEGSQSATLGSNERLVTRALVRLQQGRVDDAMEILAGLYLEGGARGWVPNVGSAYALAQACAGAADGALGIGDRVLGDTRATYLDRTIAHLAIGLAHAANGDVTGVLASFSEVRAIVDATGDRVMQAVVRLVEARSLEAVESGAFREVTREADRLLADLGITAAGWRTVCDSALALTGG